MIAARENRCGRWSPGTAHRRRWRASRRDDGRRHGRGVAGAVDDVQCQLADGHRVAVDQPAIGLERRAGQAPARAIGLQPVDPEAIVLMRALDRQAKLLRKHAGLAAMVDMTVRHENLLERDALALDGLLEARQIAAPDRPARRASSPCTRSASNSAGAASRGSSRRASGDFRGKRSCCRCGRPGGRGFKRRSPEARRPIRARACSPGRDGTRRTRRCLRRAPD